MGRVPEDGNDKAARALRQLRHEIMTANDWSLRALYKTLEAPGANPQIAATAIPGTLRRQKRS